MKALPGPRNDLTKLRVMHAIGQVPTAGLWRAEIQHDPDCPMLAGLAACLCDPAITFHRLDSGEPGMQEPAP